MPRVSTQDQSLDAQLAALKQAGAVRISREKISSVRADRPQLAKLMASLGKGDILIVTKIDRFGAVDERTAQPHRRHCRSRGVAQVDLNSCQERRHCDQTSLSS